MKKKLTTILLVAMLAMTGCEPQEILPDNLVPDKSKQEVETEPTGIGTEGSEMENNEPMVDVSACYQPIIDEFFRLAAGEYDENNIPVGGTALLEGNGWNENNTMLWDAGYMIHDFSGDGMPELLIGSVAGEEYDVVAGTMIYALFTIADGQVHLTLEGFYRNAYCILEDGSIFNQGSGGAAYHIFGLYDLTEDGTSLICRDNWFTHEKNGDFEDIRCWHNTTGDMDPSVSEELPMTLDEFWAKEEELARQRKALEMTTFAEYGGVEKPEYAENPIITAVYGNDYTGEYDIFVADDSDYAVEVVFTTDGAVRDFKLLGLTLNEITDDGDVSFFFDELYVHGDLTPDKGLAVKMNLPETIPYYGISYTDGTGTTRVFSANLSGFDGSVCLAEIGGVG